jgi:hypothetical protein
MSHGLTAKDTMFTVRRPAWHGLGVTLESDERRYGQWEHQSWWEYTGAERRSVAFQKFLADGLTRTLVAARAREMSARTGGGILLQILFDLTRAGGRADRLLNGPTNDAWITPWVEHLTGKGVDLRLSSPVLGIEFGAGRVNGLTVGRAGGGSEVVRAAAPARHAGDAARRPRAREAGQAGHPLDERHHVLPRLRRVGLGRARHLHRLGVGADLRLAGAVLGRGEPHRLRRRASRASCRSTFPNGSAPADERARWPPSPPPRRSVTRCGHSSRSISTTARHRCSTTPTC